MTNQKQTMRRAKSLLKKLASLRRASEAWKREKAERGLCKGTNRE